MAAVFDRVKVGTTTTGTGSVTLGLASVNHRTFAQAGAADGATVSYVIEEGSNWEIGYGQLGGSGSVLSRNLISSSTGALLNLGGSATVYSSLTKADVDAKLEAATVAEVRAASGAKGVTSARIADASAVVALTDATTIALDWTSGVNFDVTLTANRSLGNPSNVVVGTFRTVIVKGNDFNARALTFGSNFKGDIPTISDATSSKFYLLSLYAYTASHIVISSVRAL